MKAIIFDFFGVICKDPHESWYTSHLDVMGKKRGFFDEISYKVDMGQISEEEFIAELSMKSAINADEIKNEIKKYFQLNSEMVVLVKKLKINHKLFVLSDAPKGMVEGILAENELTNIFDGLVISSSIQMVKPSKEIFEYLLNKYSLGSSEVLFIDDNPKNITGAAAVGIPTIKFDNVGDLRFELKKNKVG